LIRYASEEEIAEKKPFRFTIRLKAYSAVLAAVIGVLITLIVLRTDTETTLLRTPGMLFQTRPDGRISNLYAIKTVNKTPYDMPIRLELMNLTGEITVVGRSMDLKGGALGQGELFIILPKDQLQGMKTKLVIGVFSGDRLLEKVRTSFVGPITSIGK
jgi:polyferredoxin